MPTNEHTIGLSKTDERITAAEIEASLACLDGIPLHTVLGGELIELGFEDSSILRVGEKAGIRASTKVLLALGFHTGSKTAARASATTTG